MNPRAVRNRRRSARLAAEVTGHPSHNPQAAPVASAVPLSTGSTRRGLVYRLRGVLVRRHVRRLVLSPAAAPVVAAAVAVVFVAVAVGVILGAALAASRAGGGWDA